MRKHELEENVQALSTLLIGTCLAVLSAAAEAQWVPEAFRNESTLDFLTVNPEGGEHWSRVWLVVLDSQLYVRLGSRAAGQVERNTRAPLLSVRIAGQEFERVRAEPAPEESARVAAAMADKYWSDLFVRHFHHPLTLRLTPEP